MQNFSAFTENVIKQITLNGKKPSLLLHACCAPCASYVIEYLCNYFDITIFYYNPNISPKSEYDFRLRELERFIAENKDAKNIKILPCEYNSQEFYNIAKGLEEAKEGGERCKKCYELRLRKTAELAKANGFDFFTTTLTISPYKNANWLNEIGEKIMEEFSVNYLFSDFKKKNGYKRSIALSAEYNLYRQDFCGCVYSKKEAELRRLEKTAD
ncbi:MAG: epoxyqueuosine reductase QueH [Clostridia bacterium]|nr:epoxyqueuosine reductase QueH [Clostridia bacterium]